MGKYLKQGFVRELEWQLARAEISHSKMVEFDGRRMHQELQSRNL